MINFGPRNRTDCILVEALGLRQMLELCTVSVQGAVDLCSYITFVCLSIDSHIRSYFYRVVYFISDSEVIEARDLPQIRVKDEDDRKGEILEWKTADLMTKKSFEGVATYIDYDGTIYVQVVHEGKRCFRVLYTCLHL